MRTKNAFASVKQQLKPHFEKQKFDLLPFGVIVADKKYLYGKTAKNQCFIVDENGEIVAKEEAIPVFKYFIRLWGVLVENANHIEQYLKQRSASFFEKFLDVLNKLTIEHDVEDVSEDVAVIRANTAEIINQQRQLQRHLEEIKRIQRAKCNVGMYVELDSINTLMQLNEQISWSVYLIDRHLLEMKEACRQLEKHISSNFSLKQKVLFGKTKTLKNYLKFFTSKKLIDSLQQSVEQYEKDANGNRIKYSKGTKGFQQYVAIQNKAFAKAFEKDAVPLLINE